MTDNEGRTGVVTKSGRQAGAENVARLLSYIEQLKAAGERLPSRGGKPDKSAIALAAGFDRQTFYNNPRAVEVLKQAVHEMGMVEIRHSAAEISNRTTHLERKIEQRERRIKHLEERLASQSVEVDSLRRKNRELREQLRQYEMMEEVISTNGRMFKP